jgi:hypothetical protein
MISELQLAAFMRGKISYLAGLARDMERILPDFTTEEFADEGSEQIDERDVVDLIGSLTAMEVGLGLEEDLRSNLWLPRNAYAALLQSSLDEYYRQNGSVIPAENRFGESLKDDPLVSANLTALANWSQSKGGRLRLNKRDPRWVLVLQAKAIKRRRGTAKFPDNSVRTTRFASKARIVLIGDWGSGVPDAIKLSNQIWNSYLLPDIGIKELHVVHLGDVYYAGLTKEYVRNFLQHWPVPPAHAKNVSSWCLAGNHDMFSGGQSYFDMLKDSRFAAQNQGSYFLLENNDWQIFGLDTSFDPRDFTGNIGELYGEQAAWVANKRATVGNKKCLMLTHHQPFSAYEPVAENLERRLRPISAAGQIDVWFWGHEHLCAVYDKHDNIRYPVLLGHGGFPENPKTKLPGSASVNYEWSVTDKSGFLLFGFAVLDFDGAKIMVQLVDENGKLQYSFMIV